MKEGDLLGRIDQQYRLEGFPEEELQDAIKTNPASIYLPDATFPVTTLREGDEVRVGDTVLTALFMPGHTPGQMIFYIRDKKIMFLAITCFLILRQISPSGQEVDNSLQQYMHNLDRLLEFDIAVALPGSPGSCQ